MADHPIPSHPMSRRAFLRLMSGAATPLILVACGAPVAQQPTAAATEATSAPQATSTSTPQRGGTLRVAFANVVTSFSIFQAFALEDLNTIQHIYEPLVWLDPQWKLQPRLAISWEPSAGGKTWTVKLRKGVTFHHGTPFTATDVIHTFKRLKDPTQRYGPNIAVIDTVEAVDDLTVRFHLSIPYASLPALVAAAYCTIVAHDRSEDENIKAPMGTGPFRLKENVIGERMVWVRNVQYWDPTLPYLDEVQISYISDANAQIAALVGGSVDFLTNIYPVNIPTLAAAGQITINETKSGNSDILAMRIDQKPFDDPRVRQAFKLVVDREGMIKAVLQGHGVVGNDQIIPPSNPYWANVPPPPQDIAKAKALLAEAGYPNGIDVTFYASEAAVANSVALGVAYKEMAKAAGINVTVEQVAPDAYFAKYFMQKPFFADYWMESVHPDTTLTLAFRPDGAFNSSGWKNEKLIQLMDAVRIEPDHTKQMALYHDIQQMVSAEGGYIVPYFRNVLTATRDTVAGVEFSPRAFILLREAYLKKV